MAKQAGHDLNYIAITGLLDSFGAAGEAPPTPLNVIGDLGGGSMFLLLGVLAALHERKQSGFGQVVDAAICDGTVSLLSTIYGLKGIQYWGTEREQNLLDGGAPFYRSYLCKDGRSISVGAIEPHFYAQLLDTLWLDFGGSDYLAQMDKAQWPARRAQMAARLLEKTRDEWAALFEGSDACVAPILDMDEAEHYAHNVVRKNLVRRTPGEIQHSPVAEGADTVSVMAGLGWDDDAITQFLNSGVIKQTD